MAIERPPRVAALALIATALVGGACDPIVERCRANTLLVAITVAAVAADATTFDGAVALDRGAPRATPVGHVPGQRSGNLVVAFPNGYPRGHVVDVTVTARAGGVVLGSGSATATLMGACEATTL